MFASTTVNSAEETFDSWLANFKKNALAKGIGQGTIDIAFQNVKFLENVIKYDRKQPEFFEDTLTYVGKRANQIRVNKAKKLFKKNKNLFKVVEEEFSVEKEILLALWGIETNFGKHVGKMDIISSLATLSYDKRRRDFFSSQLFTLLKLIDNNLIQSSHDVSIGGIITAVSKMCIKGNKGIDIKKPKYLINEIEYFFGEDQGRYIIEITKKDLKKVTDILNKNAVHFDELGKINEDQLFINEKTKVSIDELITSNKIWLTNYMSK
jgi:phosphoribosylformylglycinamidine (FGAM) synthase-like enzyme